MVRSAYLNNKKKFKKQSSSIQPEKLLNKIAQKSKL